MQTPSPRTFRSWAEIDLSALQHNAQQVRKLIGPNPRILAVVKANAYGHGDIACVEALAGIAKAFGVANLGEALHIRSAAKGADILILGPALPEERPEIVAGGFIPMVSSPEEAAAFAAFGKVRVHLAVDTGMGRSGVWWENVASVIEKIRAVPGCELEGFGSHLPVPDEDEAFTREELEHFSTVTDPFKPAVAHVLNSAGVIRFSDHGHEMVRAGLILYGSSPIPEFQGELRPVMTWKTRVVLVREVPPGRSVSYGRTFVTSRQTRIATLSVGYADGYTRRLSGHGTDVLIRGRRCPVLGRITMDMIMVDVTDVEGSVDAGEEVTLLGRDGQEEILAAELAEKSNTIPWEIFTGVMNRVERIYTANVPDRL